MKFLVLIVSLCGLVGLSLSCAIPKATSTTTPPSTRVPTILNSCPGGGKDGSLLGSVTSSLASQTGQKVSEVKTFTATGTAKINCYIVVDQNTGASASSVTIVSGAQGSNTLSFGITSATSAGTNLVIQVYGA